jgi:glycosyltransferase involved in cell wall biosynthesis
MRILLIARTGSRGGSASGANNLKKALKTVGNEVILITADETNLIVRFFRVIEYLVNRMIFGKGNNFFKFGPPSLDIIKLTKKHNPDIVQLCNISANCIALNDIKKLKIPVVHRLSDFWPYHGPIHYSKTPYKGFFSKKIFNIINGTIIDFGVDAIVCPSKWTMNNLDLDIRLDAFKTFIPNAVKSNDIVTKISSEEPLKLGLISVNLDTKRKGSSHIIPFLNNLSEKINFMLEIYGNGEIKGIETARFSYRYNGPFKLGEIQNVYTNINILLYPPYLENSGNTITEALSFGVPVIAQNGTGNDTYINENVGALIDYKNFSTQECASFLKQVEKIHSCYDDFKKNCIKRVNEHYSFLSVGTKYTELYKKLNLRREYD